MHGKPLGDTALSSLVSSLAPLLVVQYNTQQYSTLRRLFDIIDILCISWALIKLKSKR